MATNEGSCSSLPQFEIISSDSWHDAVACATCRYCSELLIDAYRFPDVTSTERNYTYMEAVTRYLGDSNPN